MRVSAEPADDTLQPTWREVERERDRDRQQLSHRGQAVAA